MLTELGEQEADAGGALMGHDPRIEH